MKAVEGLMSPDRVLLCPLLLSINGEGGDTEMIRDVINFSVRL